MECGPLPSCRRHACSEAPGLIHTFELIVSRWLAQVYQTRDLSDLVVFVL